MYIVKSPSGHLLLGRNNPAEHVPPVDLGTQLVVGCSWLLSWCWCRGALALQHLLDATMLQLQAVPHLLPSDECFICFFSLWPRGFTLCPSLFGRRAWARM